jgi:O-acetyl-ADP-ribose deacetylase (regulator of RNase III)
MGAGIAKQIKQHYPEAYEVDRNFPIPIGSRERMGHFSKAQVGHIRIYNLYGQYHYGRKGTYTELPMLEKAVRGMLEDLRDQEVKIGLPYRIGAGLAGGNWIEIQEMLERCSMDYSRHLYLYQLT